MAVYAYNATTVAVECTGTDISSAGIKAFLDANPTYGSCVASTSGPKDSYIFTLLARFTIGTPSSFKGASVWNCSNEFVTLICAANQFITYGRITQGNLDAGLSQNGGAFCLDGSVAGQFRINGGDWFFYGSSLYASQRIDTSAPSGNLPDVRLLDCDLELEDSITPDGGGSYNYTNSRIHHTGAVGLKNQTGSGATYNLSGLRIQRCNYAFQPVGTQTISDVKIDSCTSHLIPNLVDVDITFVNPDFTVLRASNINSLDVVRIEFRYQLKITDAAGAALPGISVRARDAAGSFRFDTLTNASGNPTTFPSGTLQNSTYVGTTTAPSSSSAVTRTDRAAHTIRVRHPQYLWTDLIRSATVDNLGDATPLVPDALFTMSPAAAAAITGVTITDHAGSPVSWNSKSWGITITGDTSVNPSLTAADIFHYIRYMTSYTASFGGKSGLDWHNMLQNMATTVRSGSSFYAGVLKGVRVVNQAGDPFAGVLSMMADDGTTYSPLPVTTSTITLSGVIPGSRVQLFDTANGVELLNSTSLYGFSETYSVDRTFRVRVSYQSGTSAKHFIEANIGSITGANPNLTYLVNQTDDTVYNTNGVNGAAVTGITISDGIDRMVMNIAGGSVSWPQIYAYNVHWLTTLDGIRDDGSIITATDNANYRVTLFKIRNSSTTPLSITGGYGVDSATGTVAPLIDTVGSTGNIYQTPDHVVPYQTTGSYAITGDISTVLAAIPSALANADAVRTELTTELGRLDVAVSSVSAGSAPSAATVATAVRAELSTELARVDTTISSRNATAPAAPADIATAVWEKTLP